MAGSSAVCINTPSFPSEAASQKLSRRLHQASDSHQASQPEHRHLRGAGQGPRFHGDRTHQRTESGELGPAADVPHQPPDGRQGGVHRRARVQQQESRRAASLSGTGQFKDYNGVAIFVLDREKGRSLWALSWSIAAQCLRSSVESHGDLRPLGGLRLVDCWVIMFHQCDPPPP